jgi:beta-1,4-N-acetylglucosaminyltransferase
MKIFVTVGTTAFDSMVKALDSYFSEHPEYEVTYQIADGKYLPKCGQFFGRAEDVNDYYNNADVIITHAGAGTIYKLLEMSKKIIAVPNFERIDKHQVDISTYMEDNRYLLVCWDVSKIASIFSAINSFTPKPYIKDMFHMYDDISQHIMSTYST